MTTHIPVLQGAGVRALFHRRARTLAPVTVTMPTTTPTTMAKTTPQTMPTTIAKAPARADATFGEWANPSIRPRASQRLLAQSAG